MFAEMETLRKTQKRNARNVKQTKKKQNRNGVFLGKGGMLITVEMCKERTSKLEKMSIEPFILCRSQPMTSVVVGPAFVVLIMIAGCPSAITIRKL